MSDGGILIETMDGWMIVRRRCCCGDDDLYSEMEYTHVRDHNKMMIDWGGVWMSTTGIKINWWCWYRQNKTKYDGSPLLLWREMIRFFLPIHQRVQAIASISRCKERRWGCNINKSIARRSRRDVRVVGPSMDCAVRGRAEDLPMIRYDLKGDEITLPIDHRSKCWCCCSCSAGNDNGEDKDVSAVPWIFYQAR